MDQDRGRPTHLRSPGLGYVLAVSCEHRVVTGSGTRRAVDLTVRPDLRRHRWHDWALIDLHPTDPTHDHHRGRHALLVRRSTTTGELVFYRTWAPTPVPLATLVTVADRRWTIAESVPAGKGLTGLDKHQVRRWTSWRRWTVLAMLAHAVLAILAATTPAPDELHTSRPATFELISLTCNEIQRLIAALIAPARTSTAHVLHRSRCRRRAQTRARTSHYQRQAALTQ